MGIDWFGFVVRQALYFANIESNDLFYTTMCFYLLDFYFYLFIFCFVFFFPVGDLDTYIANRMDFMN